MGNHVAHFKIGEIKRAIGHGGSASARNRLAQTIAQATDLKACSPRLCGWYAWVGTALQDQGVKIAHIRRAARSALSRDTGDCNAMAALGYCFYMNNRKRLAIKTMVRAVALSRGARIDIKQLYAEVLQDAGQGRRAVEVLSRGKGARSRLSREMVHEILKDQSDPRVRT